MLKSLSLTCLITAQQATAGTLIVLNKSDATASLVDLSSMKIVATVKTGIGPHEVAISCDGQTAVVANYGDSAPGNTLTIIDISKAQVVGDIDLGSYTRPHGIAFIGSSKELLVTAEDQKKVLRVDSIKKVVMQPLPTEQNISHMLSIDDEGKKAFIANIGSNFVTVLDLLTNTKIADIETGRGPEGIDFYKKGMEIWVANRSSNTISVIDAQTLKVVQTLNAGAFPIRIKFTPDEKNALVTNAQSGSLNIFDAATRELVKTIFFPKGNMDTAGKMFGDTFKNSSVPIGIAFDPIQSRAFVAHASLDQVSIIDLNTLEIVDSFQAGREPDGMGYSNQTVNR